VPHEREARRRAEGGDREAGALTLAPEPIVKKWCGPTKNESPPIDEVAQTIDL
jgi:hypothetical protein